MNTIQLLLEIAFMIALKMVHCIFVRHVYRRSLNTLWACLTGYTSVDDKEWVCKTCVGALLSGKIPACSVANGFKFPEIS